MRDYQVKSNVGALPDSNDPTKLGGGEASSLRTEAKTAVERTGLALAPQDGTAEDTSQLAQALMINGMGASTFQAGGTANAITLTPVTGGTGLKLPPDYSTLDGMQLTFFAGFDNTTATTFSIGQTGGTQFGTKKILDEAGADLSGGEITLGSRIDMVFDASADGGSGAGILRAVSVVPDASTTVKGIVQKSTSPENIAGVAADKYPDVPGVKEMIDTFSASSAGFINGMETFNDPNDLLHDVSVEVGACRDDIDTENMVLSAAFIRKQLDVTWAVGNAAGGLDTGAIAVDTWYYIWVIKRTDTDVVDVLFSLSSTAPTMPANYDKKRLIWAIKTKAAATEIELYTQTGSYCEWVTRIADYSGVGVIAGALVTARLPVLPVLAEMQANCLVVATSYHTLHSPDHEDIAAGASNFDYVTHGSASNGPLFKLIPTSTGGIRHRDSTVDNIDIWTSGFTLDRNNI